MTIEKYGRYFAVIDDDLLSESVARQDGARAALSLALVCLCVYKKGAEEVVRRLTQTSK